MAIDNRTELKGKGSFIEGAFIAVSSGGDLISADPAHDFTSVWHGKSGLAHVDDAVKSAHAAQKKWSRLPHEMRAEYLLRLKHAFAKNADLFVEALVSEVGKTMREAKGEAAALPARVDLMLGAGMKRIETLKAEAAGGLARPHAQGVLGVVGPYNYPAHLVNAHVIPALLTGNAVVVKPTEHCPWVGEIYADCIREAGLPAGVFNLVQGAGDVGRALVAHPDIHGILFTGSYATGKAIATSCLETPQKIVALEMGGKNCVVVLDDADVENAVNHIVQGAFLSAGQRCTATSRVLMHDSIAERLRARLVEVSAKLLPKDPRDAAAPFGPLANRPAYERFLKLRKHAGSVAEVLVAGEDLGKGGFVSPSVHELKDGKGEGYLDEELFGPDLCLEVVANLEEAIERVNALPYGLSNAIFTSRKASFEQFFHHTRSGLCNLNRSTNGASGLLPFGGVGKSGNQRPAGIDAVRYATFPVAVMDGTHGAAAIDSTFSEALNNESNASAEDGRSTKADAGTFGQPAGLSPLHLSARHEIESAFERVRIYADHVFGANVYLPRKAFAPCHENGGGISETGLVLKGFAADVYIAAELSGAHLEGEHLVLSAPSPLPQDAFISYFDDLKNVLMLLVEENPRALLAWPKNKTNAPDEGALPRSQAYLQRMYRNNFVPKERKTPVVDLLRSEGALLRSVDDNPLVIQDAASQIASLGLGFSAGAFSAALDEGRFENAVLSNQLDDSAKDELMKFEYFLTHEAGGHLSHVTYASGGAEANERAFDLCRVNADPKGKAGGRRIIAFEGSFHGRTLAALHATYNPVKRAPFEFKGYEVSFAPFPGWKDPRFEPEFTASWIASLAKGEIPAAEDNAENTLFQAELLSLQAVKEQILSAGEPVCAVIVEPFQGEGGDNFATSRFMNGLRALTRFYGVPLIFDEVQSGFGLGGNFFWHRGFELKDAAGNPEFPDCVTLAKKSQVGLCVSCWQDTRPGPVHVLQALRGHIHALAIAETTSETLLEEVNEQLRQLELCRSEVVSAPRSQGYSFAFDLPTQHQALQLVGQRFYRGFMVYIAGEKTVRFRLNASWTRDDVKTLFANIDAALVALIAGGSDWKAPSWVNAKPAGNKGKIPALDLNSFSALEHLLKLSAVGREGAADLELKHLVRPDESVLQEAAAFLGASFEDVDALVAALKKVDAASWGALFKRFEMTPAELLVHAVGAHIVEAKAEDWNLYQAEVTAIEYATYEEGRRETEEELRVMLEGEGSVGALAVRRRGQHNHVVGYAFGGPLENYKADGPKEDPRRGEKDTFYSGNITVAAAARGAGIGMRLKEAQVLFVMQQKDADGKPRYSFMTGRNRIGHTLEMGAINRAFGAYGVQHFKRDQYGDLSGQAVYYRIALRAPVAQKCISKASKLKKSLTLDWSQGVQAPLLRSHKALQRGYDFGAQRAAVGTKLTLSNWVTPDLVRYAELLQQMTPRGLGHVYFTSGQAELVDKGLRSLRVHRAGAQKVLTLKKQFFGTNTAASRSLTDGEDFAQPFGWYDWPQIPHPSDVGEDASLGAIMAAISKIGAKDILAIVVELVSERSGATLSDSFMDALFALRKDTGIPVVIAESSTSLGRTGKVLWGSDALSERPNMVWWYTGGQLGHIFVDDEYFVAKPLTLISTWDGDEVSAYRARAALNVAFENILEEKKTSRIADFAKSIENLPVASSGKGLWQVLHIGEGAEKIQKQAELQGLKLNTGAKGCLVLTPTLDASVEDLQKGVSILANLLAAGSAS